MNHRTTIKISSLKANISSKVLKYALLLNVVNSSVVCLGGKYHLLLAVLRYETYYGVAHLEHLDLVQDNPAVTGLMPQNTM